METIRTFIALELTEILKEKLLQQQQLFGSIPGVKWVRPENIHLTLKFLGATPPDRVADVGRVLDRAALKAAAFELTVGGLGAFPNPRNPKVIWAGIEPSDRLEAFRQQLEDGLVPVGFAGEKRGFSPHLTLGRVRDSRARRDLRSILEKHAQDPLGVFKLFRLVFFRSELQPSGPVYTVLKEIELQPSG